jgi:DNA-binding response OmpR family regulator
MKSARPKILVVDDEEDVYRLMAFHFGKAGFDSLWASDGESGMNKAIEEHPDAVLLDVMLPRLSGLEVCRKLRQDPRTTRLPVVMLSAKAEEEDRRRGEESGATRYLTKTSSPAEIVAALRRVIDEQVCEDGGL